MKDIFLTAGLMCFVFTFLAVISDGEIYNDTKRSVTKLAQSIFNDFRR